MNRILLNKATSSNDEPTPGYIYNEIYQMTFCSNDSLTQVVDFLIKKLRRNDLNVKLKTLKLLKHLCDNRRIDIRNYLKKQIDVIKVCQNCDIVVDELKGEIPSMQVRKEADELIKIIYSYDITENTIKPKFAGNKQTHKNRIEGFGNVVYDKKNMYTKDEKIMLSYNIRDANTRGKGLGIGPNQINRIHSFTDVNDHKELNIREKSKQLHPSNSAMHLSTKCCNSATNSSNNSKMIGFGNPHFNQNPLPKSKGEIAIKYLNEVANKYIPSTFVNKFEKVSAQISKNYSNGSLRLQNIINMNKQNDSNKNKISGIEKYRNTVPRDNRNICCHTNMNNYGKKGKKNKPRESETVGTYELKVVEDVLNTSGVIKRLPTESMLLEFAQKCDALDTKIIVSILTEKLKNNLINENENWKHKYKVLSVIEYLLIHRKEKDNEKIFETFESLSDNLKYQTLGELYRCKNIKQLKKKVNDIFVLLGLQQQVTNNKEIMEKKKTGEVKKLHEQTQENKIEMEIPDLIDIDDINLKSSKNDDKKQVTENPIYFQKNGESNIKRTVAVNELLIDTNNVHSGEINTNKNNSKKREDNEENKNKLNKEKNDTTENEKKNKEVFFSYETDSISNTDCIKNNELFSNLKVKSCSLKMEPSKNNSNLNTLNNEYDLSHLNNSFLGEELDIFNNAFNENKKTGNIMNLEKNIDHITGSNLSTLANDHNKESNSTKDLHFLISHNKNNVENNSVSNKKTEENIMSSFTLI